MSPVKNGRHVFNAPIESGFPIPGKTTVYDGSKTIDLDNVSLNGGFLVKTLVLSIDPYQRGRLLAPENKRGYMEPYKLHEPINNYGVGVVLRSENPTVKEGEHLYGVFDFEEYSIRHDSEELIKLDDYPKIPWSLYVGVAGMPGKTAWYGYKEYYAPKKGDVIFITAGAGPVGSVVAQLAKLDGLKVIASAGSEDKVNFLKSIGVDVAFNYKTTSPAEVLEKEGPINMYWDNVGGEALEAAIDSAANHSVFVQCGSITGYNDKPYFVKNLHALSSKRLKLIGFVVLDLEDKYSEEFYNAVPALIASDKLKYTEDVRNGLEDVGSAILDVQQGKNTGKLVIRVAVE